jgi:hypothetical protein
MIFMQKANLGVMLYEWIPLKRLTKFERYLGKKCLYVGDFKENSLSFPLFFSSDLMEKD